MARKEKFVNVNVNDLIYKVKQTTQNNSELGSDCRGKIWYEKLKIFLDKDCNVQIRMKTFYHELAHALMFFAGIKQDEMIAQGFANLIYDYVHTRKYQN